ncbi:MAG: hypothetical protein ABMA01_24330, partial [Chthoniobacteraceae bacterium]
MKLPILILLSAVLLAIPSPAADRAAENLIAKIEESQATRGAVIRAKLTVEDARSAADWFLAADPLRRPLPEDLGEILDGQVGIEVG